MRRGKTQSATEVKVRENRLRRMADRQGLKLMKSPRRDPNALGYGTFMLVDVQTGGAVFADWDTYDKLYGRDLDEIEEWLTEPAERVPTPPTAKRKKGGK